MFPEDEAFGGDFVAVVGPPYEYDVGIGRCGLAGRAFSLPKKVL